MKKVLSMIWLPLIILVISIVLPLIWLRGTYIFLSEEDNFANYQSVIYRNLFAWSTSLNNGNAVQPGDHATIIPNGILYHALSQFNIPNDDIQKIYLTLFLFGTCITISVFMRLFTRNSIVILIGILFFVFNFYVKSTIFYSAKMLQLMLLPLFFVLFFRYLQTNKPIYIFYNVLCLFFTQALFTNLPTLLATLIAYPLAFAYYLYVEKMPRDISWKKISRDTIVFFLFSLPILIYNVLIYYHTYIRTNDYSRVKTEATFTALSSPINLTYQQRGAWWEFASFEGISYNPWLWFYDHFTIVIFSFAIIGIVLYLALCKTLSKAIRFWTAIFLISLVLTSGASFYSDLYQWLFTHVPFFFIFREPWSKFMALTVFSFTAIIALTLNKNVPFKKIVISMLLGILLIRAYPFFTYDFIDHTARRWSIPFVKLPNYWTEYSEFTVNNRDLTVLSLPMNYFAREWYKEDIGNASHPLLRLFGYTNVIYDINANAFGSLVRYFKVHENPNFVQIAPIDYALIQKDVNVKFYPVAENAYDTQLSTFFEPQPTKNFGNKLYLHAIKTENKTPLIYIGKDIRKLGGIDLLNNYLKTTKTTYPALFLRSQNVSRMSQLNNIPTISSSATIEYKKINPSLYELKLHNIDKPIPLVFLQNFHPGWKLYTPISAFTGYFIHSIPLIQKPLLEVNHLVVNGYANAWIINDQICKHTVCKKNANGSYDVNLLLMYKPQTDFFLLEGLIAGITIISFIFILSYGFISLIKRHD